MDQIDSSSDPQQVLLNKLKNRNQVDKFKKQDEENKYPEGENPYNPFRRRDSATSDDR